MIKTAATAVALVCAPFFGNIRSVYGTYKDGFVGIVKISEEMHESLRRASAALNRSINAQAEHWLRVGMIAELNPQLSYGEICRLLIEAEPVSADTANAAGVVVAGGWR
jgi:hypothetical protein